MSSMLSLRDTWILDPPREILTPVGMERIPKAALRVVFLSSIFSYALAKTLLVQPLSTARPPLSAPALFILNFAFQILSFFFFSFVISRVVRFAAAQPMPLLPSVALGIIALVPIHLTLPAALLCRTWGPVGRWVYPLMEISLWGFILRRWAWGLQERYQWPFWRALLVVLSPFFMSGIVLVFSAAFLVAVTCLLFIGLLA